MAIRFSCPTCDKNLKAPDDKAGLTLPCPSCKRPLTVPIEPPVLEALPVEDEELRGRPAVRAEVELDDGTQRPGWVSYVCPGCQAQVRARVEDARAMGRCPACRHATTVPTKMNLRPAGGARRPGTARHDCPACKAPLEADEVELGGAGVCPACRTGVIFAKPGVVERQAGLRRPDRMSWRHAPCGTDLSCDLAEAGTYFNCLGCGTLCRVPRWASIIEDDRRRRPDRVYWRCGGCKADVQTGVEDEGAIGVCPKCSGTLMVPRRGRTEKDDGRRKDRWVNAACPGCKAGFRFPPADVVAIGVCPGCGDSLRLRWPTHEAKVEAAGPAVLPGQVHFGCGACGIDLRAASSDGGAKGKCPGCCRAVLVPWPMSVRAVGGPVATGMAHAACPHCGIRVETRREELGGTGACPGCGKSVTLYMAGLVRPDSGKPGPAIVRFVCGCGEGLEAGLGDAGLFGPCPGCREVVQVPRRCVVERRNWLARPNAVNWACGGCQGTLQSPGDELEGDWGECPDCGRPNRVPYRPSFWEKLRGSWEAGRRLGRAFVAAVVEGRKGTLTAPAWEGSRPGVAASPPPTPAMPKPSPPPLPAARQGTPPSQPAQPPKPAGQQRPAASRRTTVAVEGAVILQQDDWSATYQKKCEKCGKLEPGYTRTAHPNPGASVTTVFKCFGCGNQQRFTIRGG